MAEPPRANLPSVDSAAAETPQAPERAHAAVVAELFREHNKTLVRFLTTRLNSVAEAAEVAQEAYVRVLQLDKPGAANLLRAYLFRVAQNLAIDRLRRRAVRQETTVSEPDLVDAAEDLCDPERHNVAQEELLLIVTCMKELPEKCRKAFLMYRMEGIRQDEIARQLGVSDRMVSTYIRHAMLYCRLRLEGLNRDDARARLPR